MIRIEYSGWFQCRLSTDTDLYDEPRGVRGWTFAFGDEPNLDRLIRFHNPIAARSRGPQIGVFVTSVIRDGVALPEHPIVGRPVELLGDAVFEGRNGAIARSAEEPVVPFELRITAGNATITARDPIDLAIRAEVIRRGPDFEPNSAEVAAATGITNYAQFRAARLAQLEQDLAIATDAREITILQGRIQQLRAPAGIQRTSLGFKCRYLFDLRGSNDWSDPGTILGSAPATTDTWNADFWMGAWDADALAGFTKGALLISGDIFANTHLA